MLPRVLGSSAPASVVAGVQRQALDRLAEVGDTRATIAREAQRQYDEQAAWREVVKDTGEGRENGADMTALFRADPEGFHSLAATDTDPVRDSDTEERVRQLARMSGITTPGEV